MKKKTKSKSNNNLFLFFILAVFICVLGAVINSVLFYKGFFKALTKLDEKPIATITFKYKTANRKFLERVVWDRLRQNSPVYNGDTIHTESLSEATIYFIDGNVMSLTENTMAQVFLSEDDKLALELTDGFATVDSSESSGGAVISQNGVSINLQKGATVAANSDDGFSLQVLKGNASYTASDGSVTSLTEGKGVSVNSEGVKKATVYISSPLPQSKVVAFNSDVERVSFKWNIDGNNFDKVSLNFYSDNHYSIVENSIDVTGKNEIEVELDTGKYFYAIECEKVSALNEASGFEKIAQAKSKFEIIKSDTPSLIIPQEKSNFSYRTRLPSIRFMWKETNLASSYKIEIAKDERFTNTIVEQRTSLTSLIISTLESGKYFWRVTPFYTVNKIGFENVSQVGSFTIDQKASLNRPVLLIPHQNSLVDIEENASDILFSWKLDNEASFYEIVISDKEDFSSSVIKENTNKNFFSIEPKENTLIKEGKYFYKVRSFDSEGNASVSSEARSFYALKGKPEQRAIEPLDNFKAGLSFIRDTRFTYKRKLPESFESFLQISKDKNFKNIIYQSPANGNSIRGVSLNIGTYYWRLYSKNTNDDTELITPTRTLSVVDNLEATTVISPVEKAVARDGVPYEFKWREVKDANYYKVKILSAIDNSIVYEDTCYTNKLEIDLYNDRRFRDKANYKLEIQAHANAISGVSTRRMGKLCETSFMLVKLRPVEIVYPTQNMQLKGSDAILKPITSVWSSVDRVKEAQFVLTKIEDGEEIVIFKVPSDEEFASGKKVSPTNVLLDTEDGLRSGNYKITVYAKTFDDVDISNTDPKYARSFTVLPVEPLDKATNLKATPEKFDVEYLSNPKNTRAITLSWNPVAKATDYFVSIKGRWGKQVASINVKEGTSYQIDFTKIPDEEKEAFSKGTFTWSVKGVRRIDTDKDGKVDKIFQEGVEAKSTFTTDIPTPKKTKAKGAVNPYGK